MLKHPVVVSIIAGIFTFFSCDYIIKPRKKTKKNKNQYKKVLERKIIISLIVMLLIWFVLSYCNNDTTNIKKISDIINNNINEQLSQTGGNISSKILDQGINIPQDGIVIPEVFIDYV
jgi:hypothetical protein